MRWAHRPGRRSRAAQSVAVRLAGAGRGPGARGPTGITFPEQLLASHLASAEHEFAGLEASQAEQTMPGHAPRAGPGCIVPRTAAERGSQAPNSTRPRSWAGTACAVPLPGPKARSYCRCATFRPIAACSCFAPRTAARLGRPRSRSRICPGGGSRSLRRCSCVRAASSCFCARTLAEFLWRSWSDDGGLSWAEPKPTEIDGYPAHLCGLSDGRILCTYGFRRPPYAIRAAVSDDGGVSWPMEQLIEIRSPLPSRDLGYPCTVLPIRARLSTYYARAEDGCTCIFSTRWQLPRDF